jgi:predicted nuclease of predicted toxin-antitoxin system
VRLLLDEMYPAVVAEQLRSRGHDVVSVHDADHRHLEGAPDEQLVAVALDAGRALITENVSDFQRIEAEALTRGDPQPVYVFTTNRQFPRGEPGTIGRLVEALHGHLGGDPDPGPQRSVFLKRPRS